MADGTEELEGDTSITSFLLRADLEQFDVAFQSEGISKVKHLADVTKEDLIKIGQQFSYNAIISFFYANVLTRRYANRYYE